MPLGGSLPLAVGGVDLNAGGGGGAAFFGRVEAGGRVRISKVSDESIPTLDYLGERGLVPGKVLTVVEVRALDGVVTVEDEDGEVYALGEPLARSVFVRNA